MVIFTKRDFHAERGRDPVDDTEFRTWLDARIQHLRSQVIALHIGDMSEVPDFNTTLYGRLIYEVADAALRYCKNSTSPTSFIGEAQFGFSVIDTLRDGVTDPETRNQLNFWRHGTKLLTRFKSGDTPYIVQPLVQEAATEYLRLPYRVPFLGRVIIDALMACEVFAFGGGFFALCEEEVAAPIDYVIGNLIGGVVLLGSALAIEIYGSALIGAAAGWLAGGLALVFALYFVVSTVSMPFEWRRQIKTRARVHRAMEAMLRAYAEMSIDHPMSAPRVRDAASRAANDAGVVWPTPLFALLDDAIASTPQARGVKR